MSNRENLQVEQIKDTLRVVDPLKNTTIFGTAGIALHLAGYDWPATRVADVDLMASTKQIHYMRERSAGDPYIDKTILDQRRDEYHIPVGEAKLDITPHTRLGLLPVNVISGINDEKYPMDWRSARALRVEVNDEFTLPLDVLLAWKLMVGRPKDLQAGEILTDLAITERLIKPAAARSLREIIVRQKQNSASLAE